MKIIRAVRTLGMLLLDLRGVEEISAINGRNREEAG